MRKLLRDIASVIQETFLKSIELDRHIANDLWLVQGNATQVHQVVNHTFNARARSGNEFPLFAGLQRPGLVRTHGAGPNRG